MNEQVHTELVALANMKTTALRTRYQELFGEGTNSNNAAYLRKRIAWRIQSLAEGGLSERARQRAAELANEADLRQRAPEQFSATAECIQGIATSKRDPRLPQPGTVLSRTFKDKPVLVTVLEEGFSFEGREYKSLSAIAGEVTGSRWNGFLFFGLQAREKV